MKYAVNGFALLLVSLTLSGSETDSPQRICRSPGIPDFKVFESPDDVRASSYTDEEERLYIQQWIEFLKESRSIEVKFKRK